jgi:signal transduction histidine kinase
LNPLKALTGRRTYRALLFVLSAVPLGAIDFALLLAGWIVVPLLALTPLFVPALLGYRWCVRQVALAEAWLARKLVGAHATPPPPKRGAGYWNAGRAAITDRPFWRQQLYLLYRTTAGWALGVAWGSLVAAGGYLIALPAYYGPTDTQIVTWHVDTLAKSLVGIPLGLAILLVTAAFTPLLAKASRGLADGLLGRRPAGAPPDHRRRRRAFAIHGAANTFVGLLLVMIWAVTGRGYFWPVWTILPLALALAAHGWIELVESRPDLRRRFGTTKALAIHAGVAASLSLFLLLVWAVTGHGYPWPVWPILALGLVLGAHAFAALRGGGARIERLEETRAGAVDVQDSELRRIERDLHDGAQARLVALGMSLGLAEQRLASDPEGARVLVAEARAGVGEALHELRDLARGIHPPILADRGLAAAIAALGDRSPLRVEVDAHVPDRPAPPVETAAYFVAAESLANAAKHSGATWVHVGLERRGDRLVVEVSDDGRGGADREGNGLSGLRRRVEALDGTFTVDSPAGGPTTIRAELPCAS